MRVLIIYGGFGLSSEAEVSKRSGLAVLKAAEQTQLTVEGFCLTKNNVEQFKAKLKNFDIAFPVLHGSFGEDGQIQKILEDINMPFIGSDSKSSKLCFDKILFKKLLKNNNIITPKSYIIDDIKYLTNLKLPLVIKPIKGGSSIGVEIIRSKEDIKKISFNQQLMAEEYINGQEFTVGVLGEEVLPVVEIILSSGEWFDYKNKYSGKTLENIPPKHIGKDMQEQIQKLALKIHQLCGCRHLSRTDVILRGDQIYVLEINTLPGMTSESIYPRAAKASGLDLANLISKLISFV